MGVPRYQRYQSTHDWVNNETKCWWMCVNQSTPEQKFWWIYYWNEPEWFPLSRYFPIIVFENLRWNWNLGQLCFVFALNLFPWCTAHKSATHRAVQWQNVKCSTAVKHTKEAMLPTKQFFLYCVVVPIWISTFTFHGLLNFCAHAFLKLRLVLQISTLKASILLAFLVWTNYFNISNWCQYMCCTVP